MNRFRPLIAVFLTLFISMQAIALTISVEEGFTRNIEIATLAVKGTEGIVVKVNIEVSYPGTGNIEVLSEGGEVGTDTKASIEYAVKLASRFAGVEYDKYDYKVVFEITRDVSGLSATLTFTLAFTLLLKGDKWDGKATATGLLAPNGIVGNVSGTQYKYKAAYEKGYRRIITPYTPILKGKQNYFPAATFIEAYEYFINTTLYPQYSPFLEELAFNKSSIFFGVFRSAWSELYNNSQKLMNIIEARIGLLNQPYHKYAELFFNEGKKSINESYRYMLEGNLYTAASRSYYGFWNLLTAYYIIGYRMKNSQSFLNEYNIIYNRNRTLTYNLIKSKYSSSQGIDLFRLDALINSYERYFESIALYREAVSILKDIENLSAENITYALRDLAIALARLYTARQWIALYDINYSSPVHLSIDAVKKATEDEIDLSRTLYNYLSYLFQGGAEEYLKEVIEKPLNNATHALNEDPYYALSLVMKVERDLGNLLISIPGYTIVNRFVLEEIRRSIVRLMGWYILYKNTVLPSGFTALEFLRTSGNLSLAALSSALLHMLVYEKILTLQYNNIVGIGSVKYVVIPLPEYLRAIAITSLIGLTIVASILVSATSLKRRIEKTKSNL